MELARTAVALGLFDGVHIGHRAVLAEACAQRDRHLVPVVFTFTPESALYKPDSDSGYIYGMEIKRRLIASCGISRTCSADFASLKGLSGENFVRTVLKGHMKAAFVCCGKDFRFGSNASCGVDELKVFGRRYGIEVKVVEDVFAGDSVVSSSSIRRLLREGNVEKANELLGEAYVISGTVRDGSHIGRTIDFPTINQHFGEKQLVPAYGVYSGTVCIDGEIYRTVTNIGVKPTIAGERSPLSETHILGFSGDLYGRELDVRLGRFIRGEKKFASLDELKSQISRDIDEASADI